MSSKFPAFEKFFQALWGKEPFPWQKMLAERVKAGQWPDAIDLPTASGKTACLDIAVYALAAQAENSLGQRTAARRIWFVVDRRIVVDEAYERATRLAQKLADPNADDEIRAVAERLLGVRGLPSPERPLAVGRLRGGVLRDDGWARIPSQAAIITSTVDQLGSRLLFRGYGHSALAAPVFAGLAGNDSLILLDEAHCAVPFLQTLRAVKMFRCAKWSEEPNPTPFHVAVLSATPPGQSGVDSSASFPADENERSQALDHPVLTARLNARKKTRLEWVTTEDDLVAEIVAAAEAFARQRTQRVGVIVNRVARAMQIAAKLRQNARKDIPDGNPPAFDVELLTGRIRPVERDHLIGNDSSLHRQLRANDPEKLERSLILVSTQCLEVGADFSFDALVTECASLDALRQRYGRLARLGTPESADAIIFAAEDTLKSPDPIYGEALKKTWEFLQQKATVESRREGQEIIESRKIDFGFESLRSLLTPPEEVLPLLAPTADAPILLPAHLDLLCQTAPRPHPDPDIGMFLHGKGRQSAEVSVAFRCDLDPTRTNTWPEIASLCPPVAAEMFSVPLYRLRQWLQDYASADTTGDVEGAPTETANNSSGRQRTTPFLIFQGQGKSTVANDPLAIYPDAIILLPAPKNQQGLAAIQNLGQVVGQRGLGHQHLDVWELALQHAGKTPALRIQRDALEPWLPICPPLKALLELVENDEPLRADLDQAIAEVLAWTPESGSENSLPDWLCALFSATKDFLVRDLARHPAGGIILRAKRRKTHADEPDYFADGDDAPSESSEAVTLEAHTQHVAKTAETLAQACFGPAASTLYQTAGRWHDAGKLDPRFQEVLRNGAPDSDGQPLAKSPDKPRSREQARAIRVAAGLPDDFRHEMLSVQLAEKHLPNGISNQDRALLLHLIASHHGHARPFAPVCEDENPPPIDGSHAGKTLALSSEERTTLPAHRLDSGIPDRFWSLTRRFGWWGLAYREAILRLADWQASAHPQTAQPQQQP